MAGTWALDMAACWGLAHNGLQVAGQRYYRNFLAAVDKPGGVMATP